MRPKFSMAFDACLLLTIVGGCASSRSAHVADKGNLNSPNFAATQIDLVRKVEQRTSVIIETVGYEETEDRTDSKSEVSSTDVESERIPLPVTSESLAVLEQSALDQNPRLIRLHQEYQAAAARSRYVDKLPDPKLGANVFGNPIETAAGSQRANMNLSQTIPWLGKLNAAQQMAYFEALAVRTEFAAERLRVIAGVRVGWYRLYVIDKQIETAVANQQLLESLIEVANARIATGKATQGDVLLGTLELSQLEERLLTYRKQRRSVEAEINRLIGRPADTPIQSATELNVGVPALDAMSIHNIALSSQPEIEAARLRTQATQWGLEVARLSRRPEFTLSADYFVTDDNRPAISVVNVGEDPWALGIQVSLPIWRQKYDAMRDEAGWKHQASHSSVQELADRYDALILDLLTEANRAAETARLYRSTILPQARQTLSADQDAYSNGSVEFDRVIRDYRNLLTLELGYQKSIGDLAIANTRIQQAAGQDVLFSNTQEPEDEAH
tara:strand:- start:118843 stop:120345 length:1503 start_codon:yes stop_codon:yes gene_type:complete